MIQFNGVHEFIFTLARLNPVGVQLLGTVFTLPKAGYFATAAHVPGNDDRNLVIAYKLRTSLSEYQDTSDHSVKAVHVKIAAVDTFHDVCILQSEGDNAISSVRLSGTDSVQVGENVAVVGYPHCTDGRAVLTQQNTEVGARILVNAGGIKSKQLVLNIQARPGQSGSPIFSLKDGSVVAILIGAYVPQSQGRIMLGNIDPSTLHQTTHAVSAEYLNKMVGSL